MNIRRFTAENMTLALEKVKADLGDEAVILTTKRRIRKDPKTGGQVRFVEVVAAIDLDAETHAESSFTRRDRSAAAGRSCASPRGGSSPGSDRISREIALLRDLVTQAVAIQNPLASASGDAAPLLVLHRVFTQMGMEPWLQQRLAARFLTESGGDKPITAQGLISWIGKFGLRQLKTAPQAENSGQPVWWAVIGPTGVGKTTTIAKLAARLKFHKELKGVLVTTDTYRLGGVEQIRKYAKLMDVPLEVAKEPKELVKIFATHREKDFILVDTTGRGLGDSRHHAELSSLFDAIPGIKAMALLSATSKTEDVREQVDYYSRYPIAGWALTKTDETRHYGPLFTPLLGMELPVSYITNGQKVPEDIAPATPRLLMRLLLSSGTVCGRSGQAFSAQRASAPAASGLYQ